MDESKAKQVKAKLYNLKNGIEGLVPLVDAGVIDGEKVADAIGTLSLKTVNELTDLFKP